MATIAAPDAPYLALTAQAAIIYRQLADFRSSPLLELRWRLRIEVAMPPSVAPNTKFGIIEQ